MGKSFKNSLEQEITTNATRVMLEAAKEPVREEPKEEPVNNSSLSAEAPIKKWGKAEPDTDTIKAILGEAPQERKAKETLSKRLNLLTKPSTHERLIAYSEAHDFVSINTFINKAITDALEREGF